MEPMHTVEYPSGVRVGREYSYDLYNGDTEQVGATQRMTPDEVRSLNDILRKNSDPRRWMATPWVNH